MGHALNSDAAKDIEYESLDPSCYEVFLKTKRPEDRKTIIKTRRPHENDMWVEAMFPQTWGSTALGFGGIGGAAMTDAYVVVIRVYHASQYMVYFGGRFAYSVIKPNDLFFEDMKNKCMKDVRNSGQYSV